MLDPFPSATSPQVLSQSDLRAAEYSTGFKGYYETVQLRNWGHSAANTAQECCGPTRGDSLWEEGTWALWLVLLSRSGCAERLARETTQTLGGTLIKTHDECAGSQHGSGHPSQVLQYIGLEGVYIVSEFQLPKYQVW